MADVSLIPCAVAVTVAEPAFLLVTSPVVETVTTDESELDQVTVMPVSTLPFASLRVTTNCLVCPTIRTTKDWLIVTDATGILATVMVVVPVFPSAVAVIVAEPVAMPVTSPVAETVTADGFELDQVTVMPVSTLPFASLRVATSCLVPSVIIVADWGLTLTDATATLATVIRAVPVFPLDVAVIVADPGANPVTNPVAETVAIDGLELDQAAVRPVSTVPLASLMVATNCLVCPVATVADCGLTLTDATATLATVMRAVPVFPPDVAVIVADPGANPVTNPVAETVTADGLELDQATVWPVSTVPFASLMVAASCLACPVANVAACGLTVTDATVISATVTRTVPVIPSEFAVMVAEPGAAPVTEPAAETVTADGLELDQITVWPVSTLPVVSLRVTDSCLDCPIATVADCGLTVTDATGVALGAGVRTALEVGTGVALGVGIGVALGVGARMAVGVGAGPLQATNNSTLKLTRKSSPSNTRMVLIVGT